MTGDLDPDVLWRFPVPEPAIKIRRDVLKRFIVKNNINDIKIFMQYRYEGMFDGTEYICEEWVVSKEWILDKLEPYSTLIIEYNLARDDILVLCPGVFRFRIIDERFKPLKRRYRTKLLKEKIKNL